MSTDEKVKTPFIPSSRPQDVPCFCSQRWILAYAAFFGVAVTYAVRVNLSVAIVCMVKASNESQTIETNASSTCGETEGQINAFNENAEFDWDKGIRSSLLASFFYGYIILQIPGGWLADRFGGRRIWGICMAISALCTILTPVCARANVILVYVLRVILGLATSVVFPCMQSMWGRWAPPLERSKLVTFTFLGTTLGNIATFSSSGFLCQYGFDNGWGSIFYITGGLTLVWTIVWFILTRDTPAQHPWITDAEKEYINSVIEYNTARKIDKVPWLEFAKSPALLACCVAHFCNNWTNYTLLTSLPAFMKGVLKFDIKNNGVLTSVPYICQAVMSFAAGNLADFLRSRRYLSTRATRRIFQTISFTGAGVFLIATGFVTCEQRGLAVAFVSISVMSMGFTRPGFAVNHVDFAPKFLSEELLGFPEQNKDFAITTYGGGGIIWTRRKNGDVFYVCAAFCVLGMTIFGLFSRGEVQEWAKDKDEIVNVEMNEKTPNKS